MNYSKRLLATAHHEAGHAVAAIELQLRLQDVTIVPADDCLGCCRVQWLASLPGVLSECSVVQRNWIERRMIYTLCGNAAERKFLGRSIRRGSGADFSQIADLAMLVEHPKTWDAYVAYLWARAAVLVDHEFTWRFIQAVADELLARKTLTGSEVRKVKYRTMDDQLAERQGGLRQNA